jgi:methylmalonyl-CoA mutase C-terminal domain/subunit
MATGPAVLKAASGRTIRVLVAKVGLDGHDVGARVVARGLVDAGMEVIYTGIRRTPEQVVAAARDEDVDVVGISILSGAHVPLAGRVCELLRERGMAATIVVVGGIIPDSDVPILERLGVSAVFHPATTIQDIAGVIKRKLAEVDGTTDPGQAQLSTSRSNAA